MRLRHRAKGGYAEPAWRLSRIDVAFVDSWVATHVRVGDPLFTHVLAPIYVAVVLWGGLVLGDARLRGLLFRRTA